jgi:hypothetical protein
MVKVKVKVLVLLMLVAGAGLFPAFSQAVIPYPLVGSASGQFSVTVNGTPVPVNIWDDIHYVHFAFSGTANIEVSNLNPQRIDNFKISPKWYNINGTKSGNKLSFSMNQPAKLVIDIDPTSWTSPVLSTATDQSKVTPCYWLFVFAEALEQDPPALGAPGVFNAKSGVSAALTSASGYPGGGVAYFPKGTYLLNRQNVPGNLTIYLEPGAFIKNGGNRPLVIENQDNVKIKGRGHIQAGGTVMEPYKLDNFVIEDVIMRQTKNEQWAMVPRYLKNSRISGIKILTPRAYARDGMDPDNCDDMTIENCLVYSGDDAICIKAANDRRGYTHVPQTPTGSRRLVIRNNVLMSRWTPMKYGSEINDNVPIEDFVWENNTVLSGNIGILLMNKGSSVFKNIVFRNNHIEYLKGSTFLMVEPTGGLDMDVENLTVTQAKSLVVKGVGTHVRFYNLRVGGRAINSRADLQALGVNVKIENAVVEFYNTLSVQMPQPGGSASASGSLYGFQLTPNPFSGYVRINPTGLTSAHPEGEIPFSVFNSLGQMIDELTWYPGYTLTWMPKNKRAGMYWIVMEAGRRRIAEKIIYLK